MIPVATTTGSILRADLSAWDGMDAEPDRTVVASGIRAHLYPVTGQQVLTGGEEEVVTFRLDADPCDLQFRDQWRDDPTGEVYRVIWSRLRVGLGLDHVEAGLRQVTGEAG